MNDLEQELDARLLEVALEWELARRAQHAERSARRAVCDERPSGPPSFAARHTLTTAAAALFLLAAGAALWFSRPESDPQRPPAVIACLQVPDLDAALARGLELARPVVCFVFAGGEPGGLRDQQARVQAALEPYRDEARAAAGLILTRLDVGGRPELADHYGLERPDGAVLLLEPYRYPDKWGREHESAIIGRLPPDDPGLGPFLLAGLRAWDDRLACRASIQAAWSALRARDAAAFEAQLWPALSETRGAADVARMFRSLVRFAALADRYAITSFAAVPVPEEILAADPAATALFHAHLDVRVEREAMTVGTRVDIVKRTTATGAVFQTIWNE